MSDRRQSTEKATDGPWTSVGDGPWFVHHGEHPKGLDSPGWICEFVNNESDARLISAAPDLLKALILMEAEKSDYMRINNLGDPANEHTNKLARAAIAKAKGDA